MAKRFSYRTAIAGITAVALLAPAGIAPSSAEENTGSSITATGEAGTGGSSAGTTAGTSDQNGAGAQAQSSKPELKKGDALKNNQVIGGAIGAILGLGLLVAAQSPAVAQLNVDLQKKIGIYNPQIAAAAGNVLSPLGSIVGLTGAITSALVALNGALEGSPIFKDYALEKTFGPTAKIAAPKVKVGDEPLAMDFVDNVVGTANAVWAKEPDTSKAGRTTGEIKVTYTDAKGAPQVKNIKVNINVEAAK
ncbi:Rib/alpha-like domain-containing protein [Corynebacterium aquatimens]|uniref:Rib domain-containing protein n=1 Tax=Corynebacterium aquatimens TaxID=1190508 RepID=A0A931DWP4_9CORY|nr:Rib/alpha-like domain-containing protein [Corynebacterium aquatimens]MBG6122919.1 hypothetical protein [Corynebacterium aquatimens]WJY66746.1 hypothetical protein CAQUA_10295 [Corynebacterium aquatimens]